MVAAGYSVAALRSMSADAANKATLSMSTDPSEWPVQYQFPGRCHRVFRSSRPVLSPMPVFRKPAAAIAQTFLPEKNIRALAICYLTHERKRRPARKISRSDGLA